MWVPFASSDIIPAGTTVMIGVNFIAWSTAQNNEIAASASSDAFAVGTVEDAGSWTDLGFRTNKNLIGVVSVPIKASDLRSDIISRLSSTWNLMSVDATAINKWVASPGDFKPSTSTVIFISALAILAIVGFVMLKGRV